MITANVVILVIVSVAELVASIWVSVISGNIVCPCRGTDRGGSGRVFTDYRSTLAKIFGIIQIVLSILLLILGIALFVVLPANYGYLWYSTRLAVSAIATFVVALPAGILGIVSSSKKTLPSIIAHMILGIYSAVLSGCVLFLLCTTNLIAYSSDSKRVYDYTSSIVVIVLILLVSLAEFIVSIWSSSLTCRVTCCGVVDTAGRVYNSYNRTGGKMTGLVLIVCGVIGIVAAVLFLVLLHGMVMSVTIPTAIMVIIAGRFSIKTSATKARSEVITQWVLSLFCITLAFTQLIYSIQRILLGSTEGFTGPTGSIADRVYLEGVVFLLLSLVEILVALVGAIYCHLATTADFSAHHGPEAEGETSGGDIEKLALVL